MANVTAHVTIQGTRPLLWHHFGPDAIPLEAKEKTGKAGNDPAEWHKTVLRTNKGQLYLEPSYVFGCLRDGAKHTTRKRGTLQPLVVATLQVMEDRILIDRWLPEDLEKLKQADDKPVYLDVRSVRNPATGARNVRYRVAASPGWKTSYTLFWDNTVVGEDQMEAVLRDSGKFVGVGDGRSLGFGRFQLLTFEISKNRHAKKQATNGAVGRQPTKGVESRRQKMRPMQKSTTA